MTGLNRRQKRVEISEHECDSIQSIQYEEKDKKEKIRYSVTSGKYQALRYKRENGAENSI